MMSISRIYDKLKRTLSPHHLKILDHSSRHRTHGNFAPETLTHIEIFIVSSLFEGRSRLERHSMIYALLKEEWEDCLHAVRIKALTPKEVT